MELPKVIAMCMDCRRGFISVNAKNPNPRCHACGGRITAIAPLPNEYPHVDGAFVPLIEGKA